MTSGRSSRDSLTALLAPVVGAAGYDLEGVEVAPAGRRKVVRVVVDADEALTLDDVAEVSRAVSTVLDENDALLGHTPYVLEVSSPGVDRPLTEPRHWRRAVGRLVQVPVADRGTVTGRVLDADPDGVRLDLAGGTERVPYSALGRGRVQVEFNRPDEDDGGTGQTQQDGDR
jgi:ribosome maturation factor RimP